MTNDRPQTKLLMAGQYTFLLTNGRPVGHYFFIGTKKASKDLFVCVYDVCPA